MPGLDRVGGRRETDRLALEGDGAADRAVDAEEGAGKLGAAGADETGEPEDFAAMEVEGDLLERDRSWCAPFAPTGSPRRAPPSGGV